ncbi:hypothetical protein PF005_g4567 [Phytophthora fragariae]|uniref:Uncharacterized protein n=2 Tax=Phytophthora TaxID=4783 RepID=A0A6A3Z1V0_9STRA|nr:hypothetical protein PF003_g1164 [Phytophthora fragariae]KAE9045588.1 hypothetical protein PR001_g4900 [Phytophthora rubi]KAE8945202.1 hypothetical protein PF009_g5132 [Phytophthora fragariae]KAE9023605.1 hypothetical protein PF011_g3895 [Phytophthora fragariae]KAE9046177.1 hypothetical protein PR002_g1800 [Phytophthora rubi]
MALNVTFVSGGSLQFQLHYAWKCWTFESCDYWEKTTQVAWSYIPTAMFVGFYESNTCHESAEYPVAYFALQGSYTFPQPRAIRSVMVGAFNNLTRRPSYIYSECPNADERAGLGSTDGDASTFFVGDTNGGSGPSPNWNDALPDTPSNSGNAAGSLDGYKGGDVMNSAP